MKAAAYDEKIRLKITIDNREWKMWGPYLSERQWGTVREDYSENHRPWEFFTHDMSRWRAYRWGEDGIAGISDNKQNLCFALALWNGRDPIIKERLFGLSNPEGNHGEDVKEYYYYLDATPTYSYMKMLYKYPQSAFPYTELVEKNQKRDKQKPEYELMDTGIFDKDAYFDVFVSYAKASPEDILINIEIYNRYDKKAELDLLPTLWFRNTWSWGHAENRSVLYSAEGTPVFAENKYLGTYHLYYEGTPELLFCDNESREEYMPEKYRSKTSFKEKKYSKDGIHQYLIDKETSAVNPAKVGTKMALRYKLQVGPKGTKCIRLRLSKEKYVSAFQGFENVFQERIAEANAFYEKVQEKVIEPEMKMLQRQAYAGMLWNKQFYNYQVNEWLQGDPNLPPIYEVRKKGRNSQWKHLVNANVISMPDKWEYPWYAAWDLAFHCVPLAKIDPDFAKRQLLLMLREYYMHPNGQIPAYEWSFSDVNPPVHAWGAWKVYSIDKELNNGVGDMTFLARVFLKLTINFTWWVNQKDKNENNLFEGGFLGLDNIGVFDRSSPLPTGGTAEQADGTAWMAMYSLNMLRIAVELAKEDNYYEEMATKFFEHFLMIAGALRNIGGEGIDMWDKKDNFFYDVMVHPSQSNTLLKVRSLVGLLPLLAVEVFSSSLLMKNQHFTRRLEHALRNRSKQAKLISQWFTSGKEGSRLLSLVRLERMKSLLVRMLDENEFLSAYGIRALSKYHQKHPYRMQVNGHEYEVTYIPGESESAMFGGNSNWRGPIWFPINYMLIEALHKFHYFYGSELQIDYPTGSGNMMTLKEIALEITGRLINIFKKDDKGLRTVFGKDEKLQKDPHFKNYILFYEYFDGDNGRGLGASHQTGWTGLITDLIDQWCEAKSK